MAKTKVRVQMVPGYQAVLAAEPSVKVALRVRAEAAAGLARSSAPVLSGAYRDSIDVDGTDLVATDFKANWIEKGTARFRARRTLTNAAQAVADRIRVE